MFVVLAASCVWLAGCAVADTGHANPAPEESTASSSASPTEGMTEQCELEQQSVDLVTHAEVTATYPSQWVDLDLPALPVAEFCVLVTPSEVHVLTGTRDVDEGMELANRWWSELGGLVDPDTAEVVSGVRCCVVTQRIDLDPTRPPFASAARIFAARGYITFGASFAVERSWASQAWPLQPRIVDRLP